MENNKLLDNIVLFSALIIMFGFFLVFTQIFSGNLENVVLKMTGLSSFGQSNLVLSVENFTINSKAGYLVKTNEFSQDVIYSKDASNKMPIASLTKLMSAIVVLGNIKLSDKIIITKDIEDWQEIKTIKENEIFTADDLLKTSLIESNNSTMIALARSLGEDKFVELMNKKAEDIGLVNTKFYNETGLDLKDKVSNFSTVEDLAKLTKYILYNYPKIFEITKQKEFLLCDIEFNYCRTVKNTNLLLNNDSLKDNVVGGKTGETKIAGGCLILVIKGKIEGEYFISIVLNSKDRFTDTEKIISKYGK